MPVRRSVATGAWRNQQPIPVPVGFGHARRAIQHGQTPSIEAVMALLRGVVDPELGSDIVELGMAKGATVDADGLVDVTIALTTSGCPLRAQIQRDVRARIGGLPGVTEVHITWTELTPEEKAAAMSRARWNVAQDSPETAVPATCRVLMVASGKGGVGKSSVTVNLATALADRGFAVGVMDADIWGFSVPRMLGIEGRLGGSPESGRITPNRRPVGAGRLEVVSMGFLVEDEETALMWRGLILNRAVQHFCEDVEWGDLDYLLIDMPPGTGDVQMGLARMLPRAEMVIVTTPALAAQKVAVRVAHMGRNNYLRVVGVIENMGAFVAPTARSTCSSARGVAGRWPTTSVPRCSAASRWMWLSPTAATPDSPWPWAMAPLPMPIRPSLT